MRRRGIVVLVLALLSSSAAFLHAQPRPADFALRLEFGCSMRDVIDTFRNEFVKSINARRTATARLRLSEADKDRLFTLVREVHLEEYPSRYNPPTLTLTEPSVHYKLELRQNGVKQAIEWEDGEGSHSEASERLRTMLQDIIKLFLAMPDVQRLPPSELMCM